MSVTIAAPVQVDARTWRLSWSSGLADPTYYVWRDGALVATTKATQMDFAVTDGEGLVVAVLDSAAAVPSDSWPGRLTLNWNAAAAAAHYRVEEYVGSTWTLRGIVRDRGQGYFNWRSRWLEDATTHQFRIIPVGTNGNQGTARTFSALMVRVPDVPDVSYTYSGSTRKVTISAA